jgi:hypothetical protein
MTQGTESLHRNGWVSVATHLRSALLFLLVIVGLDVTSVAHGAVTIILLSAMKASPVVELLAAGLIPAQVCLATAWATWSAERLHVRLGRLAWQMTWLYLLLLLLQSFDERRQTAMLLCLPMAMTPFLLATWLQSEVLCLFDWRLVKTAGPQPDAPPARIQFHLADALRWITLLCVLLAVMVSFPNPNGDWDGLLYVGMIVFGLFACVPVGLSVSVLLWLALGRHWSDTSLVVVSFLTAVWATIWVTAALRPESQGDTSTAIWFIAVVITGTTLATAIMLRLQGWRLIRTRRVSV